ncbi:MAG: glycosyltransferase [Alphaproteobacteria bacterium]|nr:MAG: glycosyltransferase [Alphaproteobacteria bacterium]
MKQGRQAVLFISPSVPLEQGIGVERRAFQHLCALASRHDVHLMITGQPKPRAEAEETWRTLPASITVLGRGEPPDPQGHRLGSHLLWELHHPPIPHRLPAVPIPAAWPESLAATLVFRLKSTPIWRELRRSGVATGRLVLDLDDLEALALRRRIAAERDILGREKALALRLRAARLARLQREMVWRADATLVCSREDRDRLIADRHDPARIRIVANAPPELEPLAPRRASPGEPYRLLFIGALGYSPNIDALQWFVRDIWPQIRARDGRRVELEIVGYGAGADVRALGRTPGVRVTGEVATVTPCYARADMLVAPLRWGGGTRIKILEAFAIGRPVVATTRAAEGLPVADGRELLIADRPDDFARAVSRLLDDEGLGARLIANGRELVARMRGIPQARLLAAIRGEADPDGADAAGDRPADGANG